MEKFTISFNNKSKDYTAEVFAESEDEALDNLESSLPEKKFKFRVTEIIPQGVVSGFEVRLVGSKVFFL